VRVFSASKNEWMDGEVLRFLLCSIVSEGPYPPAGHEVRAGSVYVNMYSCGQKVGEKWVTPELVGLHIQKEVKYEICVGDKVHCWGNTRMAWYEDGIVHCIAAQAIQEVDGSVQPAGSILVCSRECTWRKWIPKHLQGIDLKTRRQVQEEKREEDKDSLEMAAPPLRAPVPRRDMVDLSALDASSTPVDSKPHPAPSQSLAPQQCSRSAPVHSDEANASTPTLRIGELVHVYSNSKKTWFTDGKIVNIAKVPVAMEGHSSYPAGSVCVIFSSGMKWIRPDDVGKTLRVAPQAAPIGQVQSELAIGSQLGSAFRSGQLQLQQWQSQVDSHMNEVFHEFISPFCQAARDESAGLISFLSGVQGGA